MSQKALENHKFFPYIAWALVIGFALFVYNLTVQVQENTTQLETLLQERQTDPLKNL